MHSSSVPRRIGMGILLAALVVCLVLAARYDLTINQQVYSSEHWWAIFMEAFGWWPLYLPALLWGGFLLRRNGQPLWGALILLGSAAALWFPAFSCLEKRGWLMNFPLWAESILVAITVAASILFAGIPSRRTAMRLNFLCCAGFWMMVLNNVVIHTIKLIWNRARFDEMLLQGNFDGFSAWYAPFGTGGTSFPSGHTAAAAGVLLLILAADVFPVVARHKWIVGICCSLYIGAMAVSRIVVGRHFLSDTIVAALIVWGLFVLVHHSKLWKNSLSQLRDHLTAL